MVMRRLPNSRVLGTTRALRVRPAAASPSLCAISELFNSLEPGQLFRALVSAEVLGHDAAWRPRRVSVVSPWFVFMLVAMYAMIIVANAQAFVDATKGQQREWKSWWGNKRHILWALAAPGWVLGRLI